jgi:hypothetical protein
VNSDPTDIEYFRRTDGVDRETLATRVRFLIEQIEDRDKTIFAQKFALAERESPEGVFVREALDELRDARVKWPKVETFDRRLVQLTSALGQLAWTHAELFPRSEEMVRREAAQLVASCIRLVVENLKPKAVT